MLQHLPAAEVDLFGEGVGAADQKNGGPFPGRRVLRVAEVAVVHFVAAAHADDLHGRLVQRRGLPEARLRQLEPLRLGVVLGNGQEHVGHAEVLVGLEEELYGRVLVPFGQSLPGVIFGPPGQIEPGPLPSLPVVGVEVAAQARDVEHLAAPLLGLGHEPKRLGAHGVGGKEKVDHECLRRAAPFRL